MRTSVESDCSQSLHEKLRNENTMQHTVRRGKQLSALAYWTSAPYLPRPPLREGAARV